MKRDFDKCLKCSYSRKINWMGGQLIYRCEMAAINKVAFYDKNAWNSLELPLGCVYYVDRFVEECNEEKV